MSKLSEKTTLYLNPYVKRFLQLRSIQESRSMSDIVNDEIADLLEDFEDAAEIKRRRRELTLEWEVVKRELDKEYGL